MSETWVVTYWCARGHKLQMETARPGDLALVGRAWCWRCDKYLSKSEARAMSHLEVTK